MDGQRGSDIDHRPLVGVTPDLVKPEGRGEQMRCAAAYADAIAAAGGIAVVLLPDPEAASAHARLCDAFVFTGGDDPRTEAFGVPTHPKATPVLERRQTYETALLRALEAEWPEKPVLGVCLGMQMMALLAGGSLFQYMPETHPTAASHWNNAVHAVRPRGGTDPGGFGWLQGHVVSHHRQAIDDPGALRVVAEAEDGVVEAVSDARRPFYLGVQWHPERIGPGELGHGLFSRLVRAAAGDRVTR